MTRDRVEAISVSLVREYLSRKGFKQSLKMLDKEFPRTEDRTREPGNCFFNLDESSINNRLVLAKEMHIERLMRKNKELTEPFRTMIEVLVSYMTERGAPKVNQDGRSSSIGDAGVSVTSPPLVLKRSSSLQDIAQQRSLRRNTLNSLNSEKDILKQEERLYRGKKYNTRENDEEDGIFDPLNTLQNTRYSERTNRMDENSLELGSLSPNNPTESRRSTSPRTSGRRSLDSDEQGRRRSSKPKPALAGALVSTVDKKISGRGQQKPLDLSFLDSPQNSSPNQRKEEPLITNRQGSIEAGILNGSSISPPDSRRSVKNLVKDSRQKVGDILFDDIEDDIDEGINDIHLGPLGGKQTKKWSAENKPMTLETATELKNLIFGSSSISFKPEWTNQTLSFCKLTDLEYGIVQLKKYYGHQYGLYSSQAIANVLPIITGHINRVLSVYCAAATTALEISKAFDKLKAHGNMGGPCGVLAAIQAVFLRYLIFEKNGDRRLRKPPSPSDDEIAENLALAVAEILWRAGNSKTATVTLQSPSTKFSGGGRYKSDGFTETLVLHTFKDHSSLLLFVKENIFQFQKEKASGCLLLLYSVIFSRGIKRIKNDMDEINGTLLGSHGYCTQELVNLLLTGKAVSNVFDNIVELDSGGLNKSVLKGIDEQSDIGFLSLFEHYGSCQVGENYKNPRFPVWVVCSESHFSVLFSISRDTINTRSKRHFDLYYYDGLARQDEEIRLTLDFTKPWQFDNNSDDLIPPLELCVRTKWKKCSISWNGTEPIL